MAKLSRVYNVIFRMKNGNGIIYCLTLKSQNGGSDKDQEGISRIDAWKSTLEFRVSEIHSTYMISKHAKIS